LKPAPTDQKALIISFRQTPGSAGGLIEFDISVVLRLWPGGKELLGKKHRTGLALFPETLTGFRRVRRAERATGRSPLPDKKPFSWGFEGLARPVHEMEAAS
jgi:hypothetical protein